MALSSQQQHVAQLIYGMGRSRGLSDERARELVAASYAESGLNPGIRNRSSGATGLFQLLSSGYVNAANRLGGVTNPRANTLAILPDYLSYWRSHPNAAPGQAASAVERSGEGAGFYAGPLSVLRGVSLGGAAGNAPVSRPPAAGAAPAPAAAPSMSAGGDVTPYRQAALTELLGQTGAAHPDYSGFLAAIGQLRAAQTAGAPPAPPTPPGPAGPRPGPRPAGPLPPGGGAKFTGVPLAGERSSFVRQVAAAARAEGATMVRVISGYRSPSTNARVGGVPRSNHTTGDAMDAQAFVPGRGWVPLGTLLKPVASKYGLRSGDVAGFYRGGPDPNHVDDGANQRHR